MNFELQITRFTPPRVKSLRLETATQVAVLRAQQGAQAALSQDRNAWR